MLPDFVSEMFKDFFNKYKGLWNHYGLTGKAVWILYQYLIFAFSFFIAIVLYIYFYRSIPIVSQTSKLYLYKIDTGYYSRVFNSEGDFPICRKNFNVGSFSATSENELIIQKTCANPVDLGTSQLKFEDETYEISLKLALPETAQNLKYGEAIPIFVEFINQKNSILTLNAEGIPTSEKFSLSKIIKGVTNTLGLTGGDLLVDVILSEKFVNPLFNLNVINIEIRHPNVVIRNGVIEAKVVLGGIRGVMYRWFWTSLVVGVGFLTISLFVTLNIIWTISSKITNDALIAERKGKAREEKRLDEPKKEKDVVYNNLNGDSPKETMDSYLKKFD